MKILKITQFITVMLFIFYLSGCVSLQSRWEETRGSNRIYSYERFILEYPNSLYTSKAKEMLEKLYFKKASRSMRVSDDIYGGKIKAFSNKYPNSQYIDSLKINLEKLEFLHAVKNNDISIFLYRFPNSTFYSDACKLQEKILLEKALVEDYNQDSDIISYLLLLKKCPADDYFFDAKNQAQKLLFNYSKRTRQTSDYIEYYPNAENLEELLTYVEKASCEDALSKDNIHDYKKYLLYYPNGKYSEQIRSKFAKVIDINTPSFCMSRTEDGTPIWYYKITFKELHGVCAKIRGKGLKIFSNSDIWEGSNGPNKLKIKANGSVTFSSWVKGKEFKNGVLSLNFEITDDNGHISNLGIGIKLK